MSQDICEDCGMAVQSGWSHVCIPTTFPTLENTTKQETAQNPKDIAGSRKPPLHLVPPVANIHECMVLAYGAKKYGTFNWRDERIQLTRYVAAAMRHLSAWTDGEDDDPDSKLPHLAHARATLGIMLDAISLGKSLDDRPRAGAAAKTIKHYTLPDPTEIE